MLQISPQKKKFLQLSLIGVFFLLTAFFVFFLFRYLNTPDTLNQEIKNFQKGGEQALSDLTTLPSVNLTEEEESYTIEDILSEGIEITYPNQVEDAESIEANKSKTKVSLPKDYTKPIEIKLDNERIITIQDENNQGYTADTLSAEMTNDQLQISNQSLFSKIFPKKVESTQSYLRYQNDRKTLLYSYQRDRATGERKLKHWTFYEEGTGEEKESYKVENATLKKNENGDVELFFQTEQDLKNQAAAKEVDPSLMDRAMRTLEKEGVNQNQNPDLLIPRPYYYDKDGNYQEAEWEVQENRLILSIKTTKDKYPLSVDPTLAFTAPGVSSGGWGINGEPTTNNAFGTKINSGDLNNDGKIDLFVAAPSTGVVYVFYNDGAYASQASSADHIITSLSSVGGIEAADFNNDNKNDLVVGSSGSAYIFYNDGTMPTTSASADVAITGESTSNFGTSALNIADLNSDSKKDLIVGAQGYSSNTGRAYIFYNDGSIPTTAITADVIITGETTSNYFGQRMVIGDFNADGKVDLTVGGVGYSSNTGRAYILYNDGSIPTTAATADVMITGQTSGGAFSQSLASGDFNADGKMDLAVGANNASASGKEYIFYNDGSIPTTAATADVSITAESAGNSFGEAASAGDLNADGRTDLIVTSRGYASGIGRTYVFYGDGSIPTTAATADIMITGESINSNFGQSVVVGDFNVDGKQDLVVGSPYAQSSQGKIYIFYSQNGILNTNKNITGETINNSFGSALTTGDFNADGRMDLVAGAQAYSTFTGRTYIFYNDGSISTAAASADVIITGETSSSFGYSLTGGDLNADGKIDLVVGALNYSTDTGRSYIFYNDGSIPTTAATADVIITGSSAGDLFGGVLASGDFNADSKVDIIVGAYAYSTNTGRAYIFYNDGSIPTTAATADVTITGSTTSNYFGESIAIGDFNADGKVDAAIAASGYSSGDGGVFIFYNDGSIPTTAGTADVTITGVSGAGAGFGTKIVSGDLNTDKRIDILVGTGNYDLLYAFYNDGSIPTTAGTADKTFAPSASFFGWEVQIGDINTDGKEDLVVGDFSLRAVEIFYGTDATISTTPNVTLTGDSGSAFGYALAIGDLNSDGKKDLIVGASSYSSSTGRVYFYEGQDNYSWTLQQQPLGTTRVSPSVAGEELRITGTSSNNLFGGAIEVCDINADGKKDLLVGGSTFAATAAVYIFYSDGNYPSGAASADYIIQASSSNGFGRTIHCADLDRNGKEDIGVSDLGSDGAFYIFYNDGSIPTTAATADVTITGTGAESFGTDFGFVDANSDGTLDIVASALGYSSLTGRTYIFYNDGSIPTTTATADIMITGNAAGDYFGSSLGTGDLNADGKIDIIVGAYAYSTFTGRTYIFYNDGSIPTTAATADVTITGEATSNLFSYSFAIADMNFDGKNDLIVGGYQSTSNGRTYIFYNDGSIPTTAATADVIITGESSSDNFGFDLAVGDLNNDSRVDLIVGANRYSSSTGRTYIFYNDGSIPTTAATADVLITGEAVSSHDTGSGNNAPNQWLATGDFNVDGKTDLLIGAEKYSSSKGRVYMYTFNDSVTTGGATSNYFGRSLASADFNADGKVDLVVGATGYSSGTGRVYIFYGGSSLDTTPSSADVTITGAASQGFGAALLSADLNTDGKQDLIVGSPSSSFSAGVVHIFYNDGSIPTTSATADVTISGSTNVGFGNALTAADYNSDGRIDLAAAGAEYSSSTGRVYIFYNDGSIPTTLATSDVIITGSGTEFIAFGSSLASGDMNANGTNDLVVTDSQYAYIFYNDGSIPDSYSSADVTIDLGTVTAIAAGDFNADGRMDLASGHKDGVDPGVAYIFYNDGSIPTTAATADVTIVGSLVDYFGGALTAGDLNADGRTDLVIGASSSVGGEMSRVYVFYNDGSYPSVTANADKVYMGDTGDAFGDTLIVNDFNFDSIPDLAVGAPSYSTNTGKVYTFSTEVITTQTETKIMDIKGGMNIKGGMTIK